MDHDSPTALIAALHVAARPCAIAVTGGGSGAVAALLAVPGASRTVLEAIIPYSPDALADYLGFVPAQSCSAETSQSMARRAFDRATRLAPGQPVIGIGATASLATDRPKKGEHRFYFTIHARLHATTFSLTFHKGERDRAGEECVLDAVLLNALAEVARVAPRLDVLLRPGEKLQRDDLAASDLFAQLARDEIAAVGCESDGRLRTGEPLPLALLSGSFNPLHEAHLELAAVAQRRLGIPVSFEMTLRNADKPAMPIEEAERRLRQFVGRPVWLTRAATFVEKAAVFPGAAWIVGADTAERIVEARFYGGADQRDAALARLRELRAHFLVAGRVEPEGRFIEFDRLDIPEIGRDLFVGMPESEFRLDVSSTARRGEKR